MLFDPTLLHSHQPRLFDSGTVSAPDENEVLVLSALGAASGCDLWFVAPTEGDDWSQVTVRIYGLVGSAKGLLAGARIGEAPLSTFGEQLSGLVLSVRGVPCDGFEVRVASSSEEAIEGGRFYLQAMVREERAAASVGVDASPGAALTLSPYQGVETLSVATVSAETASPIGSSSLFSRGGFLVQADRGNEKPVYLGDSSVDTDSGIALAPGDSAFFMLNTPNSIYAIADVASQKLRVLAVAPFEVPS